MKKFLLLTLLAGVFTLMSITSAEAQQSLNNRTNCTVEFLVIFGNSNCTFVSATVVIVPALSIVTLVPPTGTKIIVSRTFYAGNICPNTVSLFGCLGFPDAAVNSCPTACGPYKTVISGTGVIAYT